MTAATQTIVTAKNSARIMRSQDVLALGEATTAVVPAVLHRDTKSAIIPVARQFAHALQPSLFALVNVELKQCS